MSQFSQTQPDSPTMLKRNASKSKFKPRTSTKRSRTAKLYSVPRGIRATAPIVEFGGVGFPRAVKICHKYVDQLSLNSVDGATTQLKWRTNSVFDPSTQSGTHTALFFNEMKVLYDHFFVIASSIKLTLVPLSATMPPMVVCLVIDDDASQVVTLPSLVAEQSDGTITMVPSGSGQPLYLRRKWNARDFFGPSPLDNPTLQGGPTYNPSEESYFILNLQGLSAGTATLVVTAEILYTTVWQELKDPNPGT